MLPTPVIWVVPDPAVLVHSDLVTLHDPLDSRLAVHDILIGFHRDTLDGDVSVVVDDRLVPLPPSELGKLHLIDVIERVGRQVLRRVLDDDFQPPP